jgi:AraC-like DNA-binding protein
LRAFVELFWYCEGYAPAHAKERVLPDGSLQIVISLRHETIPIYGGGHHKEIARLPGCLVSGPRARFEVISTAEMKAIAGVHFRPGGAPPFLGVPASELSDLDVPLESLWGPIANDLREQLVEASGPDEVFRMLEACLLLRAAGKLCLNPIVAGALEEFQKVSHTRTISELADQTGLSQRRFIEIFRDNVGLTPKLFCRVRRFREALRQAGSGRRVVWSDLALSCGYYDQAHFIHDFRAFSGINPTSYLAQRGAWQSHVAVPE